MNQLPSDLFINTYTPLQKVACCEFIEAHQAIDFFIFWDALEKELSKQCIPFWGAVWPGAKSLAKYIWNNKDLVCQKDILDFGCGSGVVSIASALSGATKVTANDIDPVALHIACKNFEANKVDISTDNRNYLDEYPEHFFDLIFVVDMFYERSTSVKLLNFLNAQINTGAKVIISDGGRPFAPNNFTSQFFKEEISVNKQLEGIDNRTVRLLHLISEPT